MPHISLAFQTDKHLGEYGPLAALAEAEGFDFLSVYNDLFYQPAWPALLLMAQATRRATLGPAAVNPFTAHPITLAGELALLDEASGGRAYFGIARGAWLDAVGLHPPRPRLAIREALEVVGRLLAGDDSGYDGAVFSLARGQTLRWQPPRARVPLLLGSWGEGLIAATADLIDEVKVGGTANPALMPVMRQRIDHHAQGRAIGLCVGAVSVIDEDARLARDVARREVALYLPVVAELDPTFAFDPDELVRIKAGIDQGDVTAAAAAVSDATLRRFAFAGSPADLVRHIEELADAGATRVELGTPHGLDESAALRLLARRVLPAFRP